MGIRKNRKAILFSLISVLFSMLFITIFSQNFSTLYGDKTPGSNVRIKVIDTYTRNFETYISNSIELSTYKTLDAITEYQKNKGEFFDDFVEFNRTFYNCMMCGYINCSNQTNAYNCSLDGYDLTSRINTVSDLSMQQMNIKTMYNITYITISQDYPFEVEVVVNITYNITDALGEQYYAKWSKNNTIHRSVSIIGLLDPFGSITDGPSGTDYTRRITRYSGECVNNQSCWNDITVERFYEEKSFRYYRNGTSFLQRYWNDSTDSNTAGIETILHPEELGTPNLNRSYIDHYYWIGENSCNNGGIILNTTLDGDRVHLDLQTIIRYSITNNIAVYCQP
ncbi:MAG: hypothetical protein ACP5OA_01780 [Candidatus Woesearchaeota archaeon]